MGFKSAHLEILLHNIEIFSTKTQYNQNIQGCFNNIPSKYMVL